MAIRRKAILLWRSRQEKDGCATKHYSGRSFTKIVGKRAHIENRKVENGKK